MPILNFENRLFALETAHISYIFGLSEKGFLANIYWGKKIPHVEDSVSYTHLTLPTTVPV